MTLDLLLGLHLVWILHGMNCIHNLLNYLNLLYSDSHFEFHKTLIIVSEFHAANKKVLLLNRS